MACYYCSTDDSTSTWAVWTEVGACDTSASDVTWKVWTGSSGYCDGTSSTTADGAWRCWSEEVCCERPASRQLSAEEQAAQREKAERELAEWKRKADEEKVRREAAEKRAAELLERHLDEEQKKQFRAKKPIRVVGGDGASFELGYSWAGNVREVDKHGKPVARFCIHPNVPVPIPDLLLSQKLLLEADPAAFRRIANRSEIGVSCQ